MRGGISLGRLLLCILLTLAVAVVALNWTYGRLPSEPRPTGSFVQIGSLRIHYIERPGVGAPVVLIHGLPGTAEDWEDVTPLLAGHRTIAIDRPGFGYSTGGYVPFSRQLEVIDALLHKLHIVRPILVGHSYGGTISLGFAERYPSEVRGLVLVDAAAAGQRNGFFAHAQAHLVKFLQLPVVRQIANATFGQLLITVSVHQAEAEAFHPLPVVAAHHRRVLAINMTYGNLLAWSGEILASNGVIAQIDRRLDRDPWRRRRARRPDPRPSPRGVSPPLPPRPGPRRAHAAIRSPGDHRRGGGEPVGWEPASSAGLSKGRSNPKQPVPPQAGVRACSPPARPRPRARAVAATGRSALRPAARSRLRFRARAGSRL
jgi:pimeloyl-ACP methyl ester carboxylesterase